MTTLDKSVTGAWSQWLSVTRDRCHIHYRLEGNDLAEHIQVCMESAKETAERVAGDVHRGMPTRILEVGCSVGFNCFALSRQYPAATIVGIEPDAEAVTVAHAMARYGGDGNVTFVVATGERLPFPDCTFDLIVCHTVIEHVRNPADVVSEMARVLSSGGRIHLEAPNYLWPREPHLGIWCVPRLGKWAMRFLAHLQGQGRLVAYLDHLQLVTPRRLEHLFRRHGLVWENRVRVKLRLVADGDLGLVKTYRTLAWWLAAMKRLGLAGPLVEAAVMLGIYPSVSYTVARAPESDRRRGTA
jgi:SAM-dependent methyltransferase